MPRYKLIVEYDGAPFCGWQTQADQITVQGVLTAAVTALSGETALVQGAGRTDAGVHARGQVAHVDFAKEWPTDTVRDGLNAHLRPHPVAVLSAERVSDDFNARMSAVKRHYMYRIVNRRPDLTFDVKYAWRVARPLDAAAMHAAAQRLVGKHDFTTFRSTECQAKSPDKTLDQLDVGALVPAQPGALDGRFAGDGRRRQLERRRSVTSTRRPRPHRLRPGRAAGRAVFDEGRLLAATFVGTPVAPRHCRSISGGRISQEYRL
jgi:tRNA pseudouridine38-40 synthase